MTETNEFAGIEIATGMTSGPVIENEPPGG